MRTALMSALVMILTLLFSGERTSTHGRLPASEREPNASFTCKIRTGYGTATGYGSTKLKAKENARLNCGLAMIDQYQAMRGKIDPDADLELACINLECS